MHGVGHLPSNRGKTLLGCRSLESCGVTLDERADHQWNIKKSSKYSTHSTMRRLRDMSVTVVLRYMEHATARAPESEGDERIIPALCLCEPPKYLLRARSGAPPAARTRANAGLGRRGGMSGSSPLGHREIPEAQGSVSAGQRRSSRCRE